MKNKTIFRVHKESGDFFIMSKNIVNDKRISYKAKGILAYLLSKPDDWQVYLKDIENHSTDGARAVRSGIKELEEAGYINKQPRQNDETGQMEGWEWHVYETPFTDTYVLRNSDNAQFGKQQPTNNKGTKNKRTNVNANIANAYEEVTGRLLAGVLSEYLYGLAQDWDAHTLGLDDKHPDKDIDGKEAVIEAMKETYLNIGKVQHKYTQKIIDGWITDGYKVDTRKKSSQPDKDGSPVGRVKV